MFWRCAVLWRIAAELARQRMDAEALKDLEDAQKAFIQAVESKETADHGGSR